MLHVYICIIYSAHVQQPSLRLYDACSCTDEVVPFINDLVGTCLIATQIVAKHVYTFGLFLPGGCLENEDTFLCHYVFGTFLCQLKGYNQLCCRTCGVIC